MIHKNILFLCAYFFGLVIMPILVMPFQLFDKYILLNSNTDYWHIVPKTIYFICGIKHIKLKSEKLIDKGYILANHRSWIDFAIDPDMTKSTVVGRVEAFLAVFFATIIGLLDNRILSFSRSNVSSKTLFLKMKYHMEEKGKFSKRVLFFPEGTRSSYKILNSEDEFKTKYLKYGILKRIYEDKENPIQIHISSNKDICFNEKNLTTNYGITIKSKLSKSIHPVNFKNFEEFINEIAREWLHCYNETHNIKKII